MANHFYDKRSTEIKEIDKLANWIKTSDIYKKKIKTEKPALPELKL